MDAGTVLSIEHVSRRFGGVRALDDVCLSVAGGERHAVIGPNGAGKTTLFNIVGGELAPSAGSVRLLERPATGCPPHILARRGLARTFQRNNLLPNLTALENVRLAVQARTAATRQIFTPVRRLRNLEERAHGFLRQMDLDGRAAAPARTLSYGEQRQLEVAIALAGEPRIILLDEPTSGMSPAETARMTGLLARLPRAQTLVIIEHDMDVVFTLAERVTVLHLGCVIASGAPNAVRADARVQDVYLGAGVGNDA
jgi:branched-chain amino acid transport system ATP-binding protein